MRPLYAYGEEVRLTRNVRNDGTYPGLDVGTLLVRRGTVGYVRDVGTFLQDQLIYSVHFIELERMVGCREEELQRASDSWVPNRFEFRDKVTTRVPLGIQGTVVVDAGVEGEIVKVLRNAPEGITYHVRFPGRTLQVIEAALDAAQGRGSASA